MTASTPTTAGPQYRPFPAMRKASTRNSTVTD